VRRKLVSFESGLEVPYSRLVSSLPLDTLLHISEEGPPEWKDVAGRLKKVSILCLNLGIQGRMFGKWHWLYFPEKQFPFYRVGIASNFEPALAPEGCSNLYVEVSLESPDANLEGIVDECCAKLADLGMKERPIVKDWVKIPCAYVVHDEFRREAVPKVLNQLRELDVLSTGRYGSWSYSYMERAILDGRAAAAWATGN
jgi:protoporphyrinogen oxidase